MLGFLPSFRNLALWILALSVCSVETRAARAAEPEPEPDVPHISLREVLIRARRDPPRVLLALATLKRREADEDYARGAYLPTVTAQVTGGVAYDNRLVLPNAPRIDSQFLTAQGTLSVDWTVVNVARGSTIDAAHAGARAQRYGLEVARRQALQAALELYIRALASIKLVHDAELTLDRRTAQYEAIRGLVAAGVRPTVDAQRAKIELISNRFALDMRRTDELVSFSALAVALGRDPTRPLQPEPVQDGMLNLSLSPEEARRLALRLRPEVAQADRMMAARQSEESAAFDARLPTAGVALTGSVTYLDVLHGLGLDGYTYTGSALAYLRWNGFDPAVWGRGQVARAARAEAEWQREVSLQTIRAEVVAAVYAARRAKTELDRATAVRSAAEATRRAQNGRYMTGLASLLELLDAESLEQNARVTVVEAERDYDIAGARLLAAAGLIDRLG